MQVYSTVEKDAQMNRTAQRIREIVLSRFSVYIRVCGEKNDEICRTYAKKYLNSICFEIHADYVTFSLEKKFLRKECKEHSVVCISAIVNFDIKFSSIHKFDAQKNRLRKSTFVVAGIVVK